MKSVLEILRLVIPFRLELFRIGKELLVVVGGVAWHADPSAFGYLDAYMEQIQQNNDPDPT